MFSYDPSMAPAQPVIPPLWGSQPNGGAGANEEEEDWEEYELEEPSEEDDELDDEEIEDWGEDEE